MNLDKAFFGRMGQMRWMARVWWADQVKATASPDAGQTADCKAGEVRFLAPAQSLPQRERAAWLSTAASRMKNRPLSALTGFSGINRAQARHGRAMADQPDQPDQTDGLDRLGLGEAALVRTVEAPAAAPAWGRWLKEIGFVEGERVSLLARALPGGDPLVVRIGQSTFALRRAEAQCVRLTHLPTASENAP